MKVAQRERAGRAQSEQSPQVIDGFFPYVSSSTSRDGSRRALMLAFSGAAVVLLAITGWLMWPRNTRAPGAARAPIILPPPVTVSKTPPTTDSTTDSTRAPTTPPPAQVAAATPDAESSPPPERSRSTDARRITSPSVPTAAEQSPQRTITPVDPANQHEAVPTAPVRVDKPRVDYEAQATGLFNAGDLIGAREKFLLATRLAPNARAWTNYGVTLQRLGDLAGASSAYQSAIGIDANYLEAWLYQGRLAVQMGDTARAIPLFQRARAINPRNAEVNVELARLEYDAQNWTEARRFADEALRGDATNIRAYWYLAVASDPLKDVDGAIRGYSGFLQYSANAPDQATFVGWARMRLAQLRGKP
jgi:Flp pilus assembly protein TadD